MELLRPVKKTIVENALLSENDSVLVALSGGPDSVALLHLLTRLRRPFKLSLGAVYVNHQLRKRAVLKEEEFCQNLCDSLGVELDIVSEDIKALAEQRKMGIEETAREFRYDVFDLLADEDEYDRIALGHHADDRVETILFRIIRGTGPKGLQGIPIKRGRIIRPLYHQTKQEIIDWLKSHDIEYCVDQSNSGVDYRRNYIRNRLLKTIRKELNPQVDRALLNLSDIVTAEEEFLEQIASEAVSKAVRRTPGGKIELDLALLTAYDISIRRRVLRRCMKTLSPDSLAPGRDVIDRLETLGSVGAGSEIDGKPISLPGRCQAVIANGCLVLSGKRTKSFEQTLSPGQKCRVETPELDFRYREAEFAGSRSISKKRGAKKVTLDLDKILLPLSVRSIRKGDRFRPLGLKGSKKVGDFLTNRKIPAVYRDEIPVVCDARGIVWLVGMEIDDRVKIDDKTRKVVTIEVGIRKPGLYAAV